MGHRTSKGGVITADRARGQNDEFSRGLGGRMWRGCVQVIGVYE